VCGANPIWIITNNAPLETKPIKIRIPVKRESFPPFVKNKQIAPQDAQGPLSLKDFQYRYSYQDSLTLLFISELPKNILLVTELHYRNLWALDLGSTQQKYKWPIKLVAQFYNSLFFGTMLSYF